MEGSDIASVGNNLMAIRTADGGVAPLERESGFTVAGEREIRRREAIHRMTVLTAVLVRCGRELALMGVRVAVQTILELDAVKCGLAGRGVTLGAG